MKKMINKILVFLKINWFKFFLFNLFFKKRIIRKKKCFLIPYFKASIRISKNSRLYLNGNAHIGQNNILSKRNKTIIELKNNATFKINGRVNIGMGGVISANSGTLVIGSGSLGCDSFINCVNRIDIGNNFLFSREVIIRDDDGHKIIRDNYISSKPVSIGNNAWFCERVTVLKGSTIGDNVVVGFGTIIKGVIKNNVCVGNKTENFTININGWVLK